MSFQVTEAFVTQFSANFYHLSQQMESRLESKVVVESGIVGESKKMNRIGATAAQRKTTRHGDTPLIETPHSTRYVDLDDYEWADLVDDMDKKKMLADPASDYLKAGVAAMNRSKDDVIIAAMNGSARSSSGTVALPAAQKIAHGGAVLTKAKLITARKNFRVNECDGENGEDLYIAYSADQLEDLLTDTTMTDTQYNTVLSMMSGDIPKGQKLFGFSVVPTERITNDGTSDLVLAWAKSGVALGIGKEITTRLTERADKSYAMQPYACMSLGAVRIEDAKVMQIACN